MQFRASGQCCRTRLSQARSLLTQLDHAEVAGGHIGLNHAPVATSQNTVFWGENLRSRNLDFRITQKIAKDEFLLAATAQNLRKLAKLIPIPQLAAAI
jgi:hypothetical protein